MMPTIDNDSDFGTQTPRRRKMERRAESVDHNTFFNVVVKILTVVSSGLLAIGLWYIQDLKAEVRETRADVRNAVVEINKVASATNEHNVRLRFVEDVQRSSEARGRELDRRLTTAENDIKHLQSRR
jgi:hypothetical protein